jgi:predicted LPLAT superfamily acyltransferase
LVPVYNHHRALPRIVAALQSEGLPVILVDDGSDAVTQDVLKALAAPGVEVLTQSANRGKGAAMLAGFARAGERGFSHALQVDADGQHDVADAAALLRLAADHPHHLVSGTPKYDASIPKLRFYGRYLTHGLVWFETLSFTLSDSMCGFRVYPLAETLALSKRVHIGTRMDFDTDIMVRLYWAGTECLFLPTRVRYPEDGLSHFRMVKDNARMAWLHVRLGLGMLPRLPSLLGRLHRHRQQHWAHIGERGTLTGLRLIGALDRLFPRWVGHLVLYPVTAYFFLTHPSARRASRRFLTAAGAPSTVAMSFRHFFSFSISILDKVAAWYAPAQIPVDLPEEARALFMRTLAEGRGLLLLSAHLGNLELARAIATLIPGVHINALVYTQNSRKMNAMLEATSEEYALKLICVDEVGPDTAVMLRSKVDAGEVVVIVGDRVPVMLGSPKIQTDFLGAPAPFAVGPYVLAHVLECPVLLFFCVREGRGYRVYVESFADRIVLPREGRMQAAAAWAGRYAARLADYAARFPLQWYNFYDFWSDAPASQPPAPVKGTSADADP